MQDVLVEIFEVFYADKPTGALIYKINKIPGGQVLNSFHLEYDVDNQENNEIAMVKTIEKYIEENGMRLAHPIKKIKK